MAEFFLIRHAQASFGAANYDKLSPLGHEQSRELGRALKAQGVAPSAFWVGTLTRHRETLEGILEGMEIEATPQIHAGFDEFDFTALLNAKYAGQPAPENMHTERKSHFRTLRETVLEWEQDAIPNPPETWADFTTRTSDALKSAMNPTHAQTIAISSGGAMGRIISQVLDCGPGQQVKLQLQTKNCSVTRFIYSAKACYLHGFNETPHINAANQERLMTYS